jgi:hypothetical protein
MRRPLGIFAAVVALLVTTMQTASAKADDGYTPPVLVIPPQLRERAHQEDVFEKLFSKPTFLSMGAVASLANPDARGTLGGEITLNRWFHNEIFTPGAGGYLQWEYVAGNQTRTSFGSQINYGNIGIETGYAYQTLQENRRNVHSLQITPFFSSGSAHIGLRVLAPVTSGAPLTCMMVLGFKIPINVGKKLDVGNITHLWIH